MDINDKTQMTVKDVVWPWNQPQKNNKRKEKEIAWIQFIVIFFLASVILFWLHKIIISMIIYILSLFILSGILIFPKILNFLTVFSRLFAELIGRILTYILLAPFYFLCFFPGRILLLLLRKDPMRRKFDRSIRTHWVEKSQTSRVDHYKVQY